LKLKSKFILKNLIFQFKTKWSKIKVYYPFKLKTSEYRHMGKGSKIAQKTVIWYLNLPLWPWGLRG